MPLTSLRSAVKRRASRSATRPRCTWRTPRLPTSSAVPTPGTPANPVQSLWQTDSLALRLILPINWTIRRARRRGLRRWRHLVTRPLGSTGEDAHDRPQSTRSSEATKKRLADEKQAREKKQAEQRDAMAEREADADAGGERSRRVRRARHRARGRTDRRPIRSACRTEHAGIRSARSRARQRGQASAATRRLFDQIGARCEA